LRDAVGRRRKAAAAATAVALLLWRHIWRRKGRERAPRRRPRCVHLQIWKEEKREMGTEKDGEGAKIFLACVHSKRTKGKPGP
jgi:hypothetical protein